KQESLVSLGAAARTLAHEIKNPLSAMTLQTALMKKTLPEGYSEDLEILNSEINRLVQLTNRVNDFLRNPVGESQVIELKSFIAHIASLFPESIKVTGKSGVKVVFDPERARSVFENLIKNACESCTGRDPQVTVEVSLKSSHTAKVTVADRGDGIQVADRSRLFDPFFSTKIHGSGIGLAITKQFLRARNGDIVLKDRDGGGTIVEVTIPVERRIL
ncbi:MAG: HAMP domain-containing sensor histidine kinase, partial [Sphaerochaetaceae bacterium]